MLSKVFNGLRILAFVDVVMCAQLLNVKDSLLLSQDWCDIVFEGRNKQYGAYALRRDAGRRYRLVATVLGVVFLVLMAATGVMGYYVYQAVKRTVAEMEEVVKLKPLKNDEIKMVSAGRRAVAKASLNATEQAPEVVDEAVAPSAPIGVAGPEEVSLVEESTIEDKDAFHNTDQKDLPIEGVQLTKTEMVEEMPKFPGGIIALMRFMDENVVYSQSAINRKMEGDVEVAFIVDKDGNVVEVEIIKSLNATLDAAVMAAVKKMPQWQPGTMRGRPTPVKISIPVHFQVK